MGVLFGGLASLLYGFGDFIGGEGAKRVSAPTVVLWAGSISLPLLAIVAVIVGGDAGIDDYLLGAAAGSLGSVGLVFLFAGLSRGHAAAVAPAAAVTSGVFPLLFAVARGETLGPVEWLGVLLAVPAIVLCSWVADRGEVPLGGVWYGLVAGLGFGGYNIVIERTAEASAFLPLITARAATVGVVTVLSLFGVWQVAGWATAPKRIVMGNAVLDAAGNVAILIGLRIGTLARVSIAAAFYPVVTVLLARVVNSEHLRARQIAGLVLSLVALAAIALG
jgi:drug/metabolite transporter (DMT)-like permease